MPSVNLIWEQRLVQRKHQRIATLLLAVIGIGLLVIAEEVVRTAMKRRACEAGIQQCEERIKKARPLADRNRELQTQIAALEPTVALVKDAQRITLRWVGLMGELDASVPTPGPVYLTQLNFSTGEASAGKQVRPGTIGTLNLSGVARSYPQIAQMMRRLSAQAHLREVRLLQAQALSEEGQIRFSCRAQFHIPEDEEARLAVNVEEQVAQRDYTAVVQRAGEKTVLHRTPLTDGETQ
jgi:Tfp pilus assembly protein PilN